MFTVRQTQHTDVHVIVISPHHHLSPRVTIVSTHEHSVIFYVSHPDESCTCHSRCHLMFYIFYVLLINNFCLLVLSICVSPSTRYGGCRLSPAVTWLFYLLVKVPRGRQGLCICSVLYTCVNDAPRFVDACRAGRRVRVRRRRPSAHIASVCVGARHFPGLRGGRIWHNEATAA